MAAQLGHPRRTHLEHKLTKMRKGAMRSNGVKSSITRQGKFINKILALKADIRRCRVVTVG